VESVSWHEAAQFANRLSALEKREPCFVIQDGKARGIGDGKASYLGCKGWRLPVEMEWSFFFPYNNLNEQMELVAWYKENSENRTHHIGQKLSASWGIRDLLGNVEEWVYDRYEEGFWAKKPTSRLIDFVNAPIEGKGRVVRGGSWASEKHTLMLGDRAWHWPHERYSKTGFRLVRAK
jgi:formylglycine-generating enzyme required for sulfatase activity